MTSPQQQLITDAVFARLDTLLPGISVFRGEVTVSPAIVPETGRVGPYVVLYPLVRSAGPDGDLGDTGGDLTYGCQITCAAGFSADAEYVVDQVASLMDRWTPTVSGLVFGRFLPPSGFTGGTVRRDDTVQPVRFTGALQYRITATT